MDYTKLLEQEYGDEMDLITLFRSEGKTDEEIYNLFWSFL